MPEMDSVGEGCQGQMHGEGFGAVRPKCTPHLCGTKSV